MEEAQAVHVVAFPFPSQGHITPLLQFSKRLVASNAAVTLTLINTIPSPLPRSHSSIPNLLIHHDPFINEVSPQQPLSPDQYMNCFKSLYSKRLPDFLDEQTRLGNPVHCVMYDSHVPWVLEVAHSRGALAAPFFTTPWSVCAVYYHIHRGTFNAPLDSEKEEEEVQLQLPAMPSLGVDDVPSFTCKAGYAAYPGLLPHLVAQLSNVSEADFILCNTLLELEHDLIAWMRSQEHLDIMTIGPTIPSTYLDKRLQHDTDYGVGLNTKDDEYYSQQCIEWLDSKEEGAVVYVAFGSMVVLGEDEMHELARGLERSKRPFLWVVRESEKNKIPRDFVGEEEEEERLVVGWSPQVRVLAHAAVGCFVTHCGWNSMLEALSLGVPMVGMPQWTDQPTNAKLVADVWRVGVRVRVDESTGMCRREEIEESVREVMSNVEIKENCVKWRERAIEAVSEGGSSSKNIDEFLEKLVLASQQAAAVAADDDGKT